MFMAIGLKVQAQSIGAFSGTGVVTEASMEAGGHPIATNIQSVSAPAVRHLSFGCRVTMPSQGTLNITAVSYKLYFNNELKVTNTLAAFNASGNSSRPDMKVEDQNGNVVSVNGVQTAGATVPNAKTFWLEDHYVPVNGTATFPLLLAVNDQYRMEYHFKGAFNGTPFELMGSSVVIVVPTPVSDLTATVQGQTTVRLDWTDMPSETAYQVTYSKDGGVSWISINLPSNTTDYTLFGLAPGTEYQFRVIVVEGGEGAISNLVTATTLSLPTLTVGGGQSVLTLSGGTGMTGGQVLSLLQVSTDLEIWGSAPVGTTVSEISGTWRITVPGMPARCFFRFLTGESL